jgi:hypothetical protein
VFLCSFVPRSPVIPKFAPAPHDTNPKARL